MVIKDKLSKALGMDLSPTFFLDYPSVAAVARYLDKVRGITGTKHEEADSTAATAPRELLIPESSPGAFVGLTDLLSLQDQLTKNTATAQFQTRFSDAASKCYPDMLKYVFFIETILEDIEGMTLFEAGLIGDKKHETIVLGRKHLKAAIAQHWSTVPEVRNKFNDYVFLTKRDQRWK